MSFNVTQCPACESTFNTNSRVLAAAAGRVRCGACLNVFEAIDNFLIPEDAEEAQDQDESVFVGNDPQEYFDPSSFLTRSALRETHGEEPDRGDPIDEQNRHQELEQAETVGEEFFATVAGELQGREEAPALENPPKIIDEDQQASITEESIDEENIDEEFEEGILDSFAIQATEAHEFTVNDAADSSAEEQFESEPAPADAIETHSETTQSFLGSGLSASFSFDPKTHRGARINEAESDTPPDNETTGEQSVEPSPASSAEAEANLDTEELTPDTAAQALDQDAQASDDTESSLRDDEATDPPENVEATHVFSAVEATSEPLPVTESIAASEPIADPAADNETLSIDSESLNAEASTIEAQTKPEELASESAAEEEARVTQAPQTSAQELDEDSTEAIRSRALEAELSDEEALEAIPLENLAALGNMSTPVELLARRESRLLRSSLLFLSILLLGGLLSSQYLWQRMELYSQHPQLRPLYEAACTYLSCTLPEYTDIDSIRSDNLTVQTHPSFANGLMVNTVMRNTAAFEQPFPILILSFNSTENSVIALREFTSAEYLEPGLRSIQSMPPMTPVQIGLAIMDPGPEAVNYTLAFRWP